MKAEILRFLPGLFLPVVLALVSGCGTFIKLKREVKRLESDVYVGVSVAAREPAGSPVVMAVWRQADSGTPAFMNVVRLGPDETDLAFSLPPAPDYAVVALADANGNDRYDEGEGWWSSGMLVFDAQRRTAPLEVRWNQGPVPPELRRALQVAREQAVVAKVGDSAGVPVALGRLIDWDAPRFAPDAGSLGLWQPATALNRFGVGVWFVEPYDPQRIPVLLVHGIGGTGGDWREFAPRLDAKRFQVWVFAYPSGLRVNDSAEALHRSVARLQERYGFAQLDVVAHSMGGLVARRYLQLEAGRELTAQRHTFVTISTPWLGHEAAALGVNYAPEAVPAWLDLQTGSEFTGELLRQPLPPGIVHHLGFTFQGGNNPVLPESNDGVVSVASQLAPAAQAGAASLRGFDTNHSGGLHDEAVAKWVNEVLAGAGGK